MFFVTSIITSFFKRSFLSSRQFAATLFITVSFLCDSTSLLAQKEAANWYFGYGAGLSFSGGEPVFQKGSISQWEGCSSISDGRGNLLFYTNGAVVWNSHHKVMPNGKGLKGHNSSTQSSVVVKKPGSKNIYFVFTVTSTAGKDGLQYSVVDMNAENGLGNVTEKNIALFTPVCEKITAVIHANKTDFWVITHAYNTDEYYAFLVSANGVDTVPVISKTGNLITSPLNAIGYLKASPDGTKLAAAHMLSFTEVSDFNASTGVVSNTIKIPHDPRSYAYGVEFSRAGDYVYLTLMEHINGTGGYTILQYRVHPDADTLNLSRYLVAQGNVGGAAGALQLAPDNKIYVAFNQKHFLGCIQQPGNRGRECGFVLEQVSLGKAKSGLGLPSFVQSYLLSSPASGYLLYIGGFLLLALILYIFLWRRRKQKKNNAVDHPSSRR